jgi:hypothetical protein
METLGRYKTDRCRELQLSQESPLYDMLLLPYKQGVYW